MIPLESIRLVPGTFPVKRPFKEGPALLSLTSAATNFNSTFQKIFVLPSRLGGAGAECEEVEECSSLPHADALDHRSDVEVTAAPTD